MQTRMAFQLYRNAGVPEGSCGLPELQKFQEYLGPQGYQIVVICASNCVILFKDDQWNETKHKLCLVKSDHYFDGLTSIPAFINRSYFCFHCNRGYDHEDHSNHNCMGQNCPSCLRRDKTCPNYASWLKPTFSCDICHVSFYGQDCFDHHKKKKQCQTYKKCLTFCHQYSVNKTKPHRCYHSTCRNCKAFVKINEHRCFSQPISDDEEEEDTEEPEEISEENSPLLCSCWSMPILSVF